MCDISNFVENFQNYFLVNKIDLHDFFTVNIMYVNRDVATVRPITHTYMYQVKKTDLHSHLWYARESQIRSVLINFDIFLRFESIGDILRISLIVRGDNF